MPSSFVSFWCGAARCLHSQTNNRPASAGPSTFYRGWTALFVRVAPLYVIYLPVYEQVRVRVFGLGYMT